MNDVLLLDLNFPQRLRVLANTHYPAIFTNNGALNLFLARFCFLVTKIHNHCKIITNPQLSASSFSNCQMPLRIAFQLARTVSTWRLVGRLHRGHPPPLDCQLSVSTISMRIRPGLTQKLLGDHYLRSPAPILYR